MEFATSGRRDRDIARWQCAHHEYPLASDFFAQNRIAAGIHSVPSHASTLDLLYEPTKSKVLHVFFHGALDVDIADAVAMPVFSGASIGKGINASKLMVSDPTLECDRRLRIGWFCGGHDGGIADLITEVVKHVVQKGGYRNVIFIGGSAGGFAALRTAAQFENATAVVWNPQTNVEKYHRPLANSLARYGFGLDEFSLIPESSKRHLTILDADSGLKDTNVVYLQNRHDEFHAKSHLMPFMETFHPGIGSDLQGAVRASARHLVLLGAWEGGHVAPPRHMTREILRAMSRYSRFKDDLGEVYAHIGALFGSETLPLAAAD